MTNCADSLLTVADSRKKLSGAQFKKISMKKRRINERLLKNIPKLNKFFTKDGTPGPDVESLQIAQMDQVMRVVSIFNF